MMTGTTTNRVVIVGGVRIPFVKAMTSYAECSNKDMMAHVLKALVAKYALRGKKLGDVSLGAVMKYSSDWNMARECVLESGLAPETPAYDVQRACGTSLEAAINIANKIALGQIDCGIAAGVDTQSDIPLMLNPGIARRLVQTSRAKKLRERLEAWKGLHMSEIKPHFPSASEPRTLLSMGEHTEKMAKEWKIPRAEQDELALESHKRGVQAYEEGFYSDLVVEYQGVKRDPVLRPDTTLAKLAKLPPAFDHGPEGTLTAGNSSPLSDGASACLLASESYAKKMGWPILAYFRDAQVAAVDFVAGEGLLMAPAVAVPELLKRNKLELQDFDFYEIHEAFAAQVLCTLKAWESKEFCNQKLARTTPLGSIDRAKMNVKGGSVAIGHPFAATGTRILASGAKMLHERGSGRLLISICTAGGMGVAAILERSEGK